MIFILTRFYASATLVLLAFIAGMVVALPADAGTQYDCDDIQVWHVLSEAAQVCKGDYTSGGD